MSTAFRSALAVTAAALAAGPAVAQSPMSASSAASLTCLRAGNPTRYPEARASVQAATQQGGAAGAFAQGCLHLADDRDDQAATAFEQAVRADERNAVYHFFLGQAYGAQAQRAGLLGKASLARKTKAEFDRAVQLDPDFVEARQGLMQFYLIAPGVMGGSQQKAREQAYEIRRRNPYLGTMAYATISLRDRDTTTAVRELEGAVRQFPDSASPMSSLAALHIRRGNTAAAWTIIDRFARAHPERPAALYAVGRAAAETGEQLDRGAAALTRYVATRPGPADPPLAAAHWRLGVIQERQGRRDAARAEYTTALRLDPKHEQARAALAKLK
jgi:tetratricopeptide (TPR) repeat protein